MSNMYVNFTTVLKFTVVIKHTSVSVNSSKIKSYPKHCDFTVITFTNVCSNVTKFGKKLNHGKLY